MKRIVLYLVVLISSLHCRERYDVPYQMPDLGLLVVEGVIHYGGTTEIKLSRTTPLADRRVKPESNAILVVEGEDNSSYPLIEADSGLYYAPTDQLSSGVRYRLRIRTGDNQEYLSEYKLPITTSPIDSITWERSNNDLEIFVRSNASPDHSIYYKWEYEETWEFLSRYRTNLKFEITEDPIHWLVYDVVYYNEATGEYNDSIYRCWQNRKSSEILIGSTAQLSGNVLYQPIRYYPQGAWELSQRYHIRIKQYGLSREGYNFYERMRKNTESLGSIFDAQPSELNSNIICVTDPSVKVLGYVEVSSVEEKSIFIHNDELESWNYDQGCAPQIQIFAAAAQPKTYIRDEIAYQGYLPTVVYGEYDARDIYIADQSCVDCTLRGYNTKPSFWP